MTGHSPRSRRPALIALAMLAITAAIASPSPTQAGSGLGLTVAAEHRCSAYDRKDYPYPQSVELDLIAGMGGRIYGPYTGRYFPTRRHTDIEHIVAVSEAHDSGLCAADRSTRRRFASDPLNLTLAAPEVNRCNAGGKCGYDAAEWQPRMNRCWFAARIVAVKRKYALTVDRAEATALRDMLAPCTSTHMQFTRP